MNSDKEKNLLHMAESLGFSAAALIDTSQIVFEPTFRACCEDNYCGMYGKNYACPPASGMPEEMKSQILTHKKAFVLQSIWEVSDLENGLLLKECEKKHDAKMRDFIR